MTIWQLAILFKPLVLSAVAAWVYSIKWALHKFIPAGRVRDCLYRER
jgi:hypothetical protein